MIEIHRFEPIVFVPNKIRLSKSEHILMTALGMMDNKIIPIDLLVGIALENEYRVPDDQNVIRLRISRLQKKIGRNFVQCKAKLGYYLTEEIRFIH